MTRKPQTYAQNHIDSKQTFICHVPKSNSGALALEVHVQGDDAGGWQFLFN